MSAKAVAFNVYLKGKLMDTFWFTGYTAGEVRRSLIEHDGYDPRISVISRRDVPVPIGERAIRGLLD